MVFENILLPKKKSDYEEKMTRAVDSVVAEITA